MRLTAKIVLPVFTNGLRTVVLSIGNLLIAWLVIRQTSAEEWGTFVPYLVGMGLVTHVLGWGNKEFLLRQFSLDEKNIASAFYSSLGARTSLVVVVSLVSVFLLPVGIPLVWLLGWLVAFFLYQSCDAWITYQKAFGLAALVDALGLGLIVGALFLQPQTSFSAPLYLIALYAMSYTLRWLLLFFLIGLPKLPGKGALKLFNLEYLSTAAPLLLVGLVGLLSSKMDLYVVSYTLDAESSGQYQILTGGLNFIRATAGFIVYAFITDIYKMSKAEISLQLKRLTALGVGISLAGVVALSLLFRYGLDLTFDLEIYLVAVFYCLPTFVIILCVIYLYRIKKEAIVIRYGIINAGVNFTLSLVLLPVLGILGGLLAGFISLSITAVLYLLAFNRK